MDQTDFWKCSGKCKAPYNFLETLVSSPIWEAGKTIDLYWPTQLEQGGAKIDDCTACFTQIADYFKDYINGK